jgi:hypothetical protein
LSVDEDYENELSEILLAAIIEALGLSETVDREPHE